MHEKESSDKSENDIIEEEIQTTQQWKSEEVPKVSEVSLYTTSEELVC